MDFVFLYPYQKEKNMNIVIVDDDVLVTEALKTILESS